MRTLSALLIATVFSCAAAAEQIIYVNHAATGANDGSSWEDAFVDLRDALAAAADAGGEDIQIWVAAGEYTPGPSDEETQAAFQLVSGVAMYGGFVGWETMVEQRDWLSNQTVLTVVFNETVLMGKDLEAGSLLDGFFIEGAWSSQIDSGGGLALYDSTFSIANCEFRDNISVYHGASIAAFGSTLTVTATTFNPTGFRLMMVQPSMRQTHRLKRSTACSSTTKARRCSPMKMPRCSWRARCFSTIAARSRMAASPRSERFTSAIPYSRTTTASLQRFPAKGSG